MGVTIGGKTFEGHSLSITGGRVLVDGRDVTEELDGEVKGAISTALSVKVEGDLMKLTTDKSVTCSNVDGDVTAGGSVSCQDVGGDVDAAGSVNCKAVQGSVTAGGSVNCGDVGEGVDAGGSVKCGDVQGDVSTR